MANSVLFFVPSDKLGSAASGTSSSALLHTQLCNIEHPGSVCDPGFRYRPPLMSESCGQERPLTIMGVLRASSEDEEKLRTEWIVS